MDEGAGSCLFAAAADRRHAACAGRGKGRRAAQAEEVAMERAGQGQTTARRWAFDHHRLDAYTVALEALVAGEAVAKQVPRGHGTLVDQFRRALEGAFTQTTEASARTGADRLSRFRIARAEAGEAAGIVEALERLGLVSAADVGRVLELLWRLCAMLTKLSRLGAR
jgi:four helix bundle protein